jgi:hypothetical protein
MALQHNPKIVTNGLVLCLDAGNPLSYSGSGTAWNDLSGNGNNGTLTNGPTFSSANNGFFSFDGTNDYGTIPASSLWNFSTNNLTIEFWFYINATPGSQFARYLQFANGDVYTSISISVNDRNTNQILISLSSNGSSWDICNTVGGILIDNRWNHCVLTRVGSSFTFYVNLVPTSIVTSASALYYSAAQVPVFGGQASSSRFINGKISQIRVYNGTGLSFNEITQNYNATKGRFGL